MGQNRLTLLDLDINTSFEEMERHREISNELMDILLHPSHEFKSPSQHKRIVIVGGGIIGIMSAFYLQLKGYQVTLIERKSFGAAASGRNGGGVVALGRPLSEFPLISSSIELWNELSRHGVKTSFTRTGHTMVARNAIEKDTLERIYELCLHFGYPMKLMKRGEVKEHLPTISDQVISALHSGVGGQSYPLTTISDLISLLRKKGAILLDQEEVIEFKRNGDEVTEVVTKKGNVKGDSFLICAGPWSEKLGQLLNIELPVRPRRSQIMVTEIRRNREINPFVSGNNIYTRQTHAGNIIFGGGGPWEQNGYDVRNTNEGISRLTSRFLELFPSYNTVNLIRAFAGTVEITPDLLPLLGKTSSYSNVFVSTGYHGHGFGMSAGAGKMVSELIAYEDHEKHFPSVVEKYLSSFSPERFARVK